MLEVVVLKVQVSHSPERVVRALRGILNGAGLSHVTISSGVEGSTPTVQAAMTRSDRSRLEDGCDVMQEISAAVFGDVDPPKFERLVLN
jgi:hypothetical protein